MSRPFLRYTVAQLEGLFANGKNDPSLLKDLEIELKNRQVPRAQTLLLDVREALAAQKDMPESKGANLEPATLSSPLKLGGWPMPTSTSKTPSSQTELSFDAATRKANASELEVPRFAPIPKAPASAPAAPVLRVEINANKGSPSSTEAAPSMSLDAAFKLLKCGPTTGWEEIERTRRQLVSKSHPARLAELRVEDKARAMADAKQVNLAVKTLLASRWQ